jgi:hypothetical protein
VAAVVVVVALAGVAAAGVAAVDVAGDEESAMTNIKLRSMLRDAAPRTMIILTMAAFTQVAVVHSARAADTSAKPPAKTTAKASSKPKAAAQKAFATPEELFQALADAAKAFDRKALTALLGPGGEALVVSSDEVMDRQRAATFSSDYAAKHAVVKEGDAKAILTVGTNDWPLPIPAVQGSHGWTLDTRAGSREILARRIGQNELSAIQTVRAIVDAEQEYSSEDRDGDGYLNYAGKFVSTAGKKDGLYWPSKEGEPESPLGPLVVRATAEGYKGKGGVAPPFHGYYFRLLTGQGKDAPGGARNYLVRNRLLGGVAVVAYPAVYGNSGIMTFIANQDGTVHQKDLGANTTSLARGMKLYNPDPSWTAVK